MAIRLSGRTTLALLVCALLWTLTMPGAAGAAEDGPGPAAERGDQYLEDAADRLGLHGAAWALIRDGEVAHTGVRGEDGNGDPVDEHTGFVLGSLSKPLLATVVMDLVDTGDLGLSDPVAERLPAIGEIDGGDEITVEHLLQHRSGLPSGNDLLDADDPERTPADVVGDLGDVELLATPGEQEQYSSLGYVVLSAYVEEVTGESLADLTEQTLPLPDLGQSADAAADVPGGYRGIAMPAQQAPYDGAGLGYGYSSGSVTTLATLAVETLGDRERLQRMTQVPGEQDTETGLGWRVNSTGDEPRVFHTGMVAGYFTAVHLLPEQDLAVVMATNRSGYLDQTRLYEMSEGLLHAAQDEDAALPGFPVTQLAIVLVAVVWAGLAGRLIGRRGRVRGGLGVLLLVVLAIAPVAAALLSGIGVSQLMLWLPDVTIAVELIAVLALLVALAVRLRPWQDRARGRRDA